MVIWKVVQCSLVEENVHNICPQSMSLSHNTALSNVQEKSVTAKTGMDA